MTTIEWTHGEGYQGKTWNVLVGCSKVSLGCQNCYAIKEAHRLAGNPNPKISSVYQGLSERRGNRTEWTGLVKFIPERLEIPLKTRKPTMWFVNSMSDLFHESVTDEQLDQIFAVMALTPRHIYQCLTKRPERMLEYLRGSKQRIRRKSVDFGREYGIDPERFETCDFDWPLPNIWAGVTVENQKAADDRIPLLLQTPAAVRFLSCEPLLEKVDVFKNSGKWPYIFKIDHRSDLSSPIDWIIVGGESGHKARECHTHWIQSIVWRCKNADIPCFVKQMGSNCMTSHEHSQGIAWPPSGKGGDISQFPKDLQVREFPQLQEAV